MIFQDREDTESLGDQVPADRWLYAVFFLNYLILIFLSLQTDVMALGKTSVFSLNIYT